MGSPIEFEVVSTLAARRDEVWRVVSTMKGVNFELHPFVHMTSRRKHQVLSAAVTPGQVVVRSWLLLFGVVPFDRHSLAFESLDDGRGFVEESSSWLQRRWRHERTLTEASTDGCVVSDRLTIEPRLGHGRHAVVAIAELLFEHRHRRLRKRFGTAAIPADRDSAARRI